MQNYGYGLVSCNRNNFTGVEFSGMMGCVYRMLQVASWRRGAWAFAAVGALALVKSVGRLLRSVAITTQRSSK